MSRKEISKIMERKLHKWFSMTLDTNNDGLVNWTDFEHAIEVQISFFNQSFSIIFIIFFCCYC